MDGEPNEHLNDLYTHWARGLYRFLAREFDEHSMAVNQQFRKDIRDPSEPILIYEALQPEISMQKEAVVLHAAMLVQAIDSFGFDGILFPDVRDEGSGRWRPLRVPSRDFASCMRNRYVEKYEAFQGRLAKLAGTGASHPGALLIHPPPLELPIIIAYTFPYHEKGTTRDWIRETAKEKKIGNIVAVGKSHAYENPPGYTVTEACEMMREMTAEGEADIFRGAIAMDTRENEDERMVAKAKSGAQCFITQIFYNGRRMAKLIEEYQMACAKARVEPVRVLLSSTPISSKPTLDFIEDLRREPVEDAVKREVFDVAPDGKLVRKGGEGYSSIFQILREYEYVFDTVKKKKLDVPLGVVVEGVTNDNFGFSLDLAKAFRVVSDGKGEYAMDRIRDVGNF